MELARLGVVIDPAPAERGSDGILAALKRIEDGVNRLGNTLGREERKTKGAFAGMADAARQTAAGVRSAFDGMTNAVGILSPQLGFAMQAFRMVASGVAGTVTALRNAASGATSFAAAARNVAIVAGGVTTAVGLLTVAVGALLAVLLPLAIAAKAAHAAFGLFADGVKGAAEFEDFTNQFAVLLGSFDKAKERMTELAEFGRTTPFELPGVVKASLILELFTKGALSTGDGLRMIGDAAAQSRRPIEDIALAIGRLYQGIQSGTSIGEAVEVIRPTGIIDAGILKQVQDANESMNSGGKRAAELWKVIADELKKASGQMDVASRSFNGRVSNLTDSWNEFKRVLGEPIKNALSLVVLDLTELVGRMVDTARGAQPAIQALADTVANTLHVMMEPGGFQAALDQAAINFAKLMDGGLGAAADRFNELVKKAIGVDMKAEFKKLMEADFWSPLGAALQNIATAFINAIIDSINQWLDEHPWLRGAMQLGGQASGAIVKAATLGTVSQPDTVKAFSETGAFSKLEYKDVSAPFAPVVSDAASAEKFMETNGLRIEADTITIAGDLPTSGGGIAPGALALLGEAPADASPDFVGPPSPFDGMTDFERRMAAREAEVAQMRAAQTDDAQLPPRTATDLSGLPAEVKPAERTDEWKKMESDAKRFIEDARSPQQEYEDQIKYLRQLRDEGLLTSEQFQAASTKAHEKYAKELDDIAKASKRMAEDGMTGLQRLAAQWGNLTKQVDNANVQIAQSISSNLTEALSAWADGTKSASEAFSDMANAIVKEIIRIVIQLMVQYAISSALGMVGPITMPAVPATVKHDGGEVGDGGPSRNVSPGVFSGAPRYHQGGMAGLQPGETPAILERGEVVLSRDEVAAMRDKASKPAEAPAAAPRPVQIINVMDPTQIAEYLAGKPEVILNVISRKKSEVRAILQ